MKIETLVFPLPNLVFFPRAIIPLQIFESRYRMLIRDALKRDKTLTLVLLRPGWERRYCENPETYSVGCLGTIDAYESLPTGHYNILLRGLQRVRLQSEVRHFPYRRALAELLEEKPLPFTQPEQLRLLEHLRGIASIYFQEVLQVEPEAVLGKAAEADIEAVVNRTALALDMDAVEKQQLLELDALEVRYHFVKRFIDARLASLRTIKATDRLDFTPGLN